MNRYVVLVLSGSTWFIHVQSSDKVYIEGLADTLARQSAQTQFRVVDMAQAVTS